MLTKRNNESRSAFDPRLKQHRSFDGIEMIRRALRPAPSPPLPRQVDLRRWMSPIVNQDNMNTWFAVYLDSYITFFFG